jgi:hypothetical protein
LSALPEPTIETYLRGCAIARQQKRIAERTMPRLHWKLWRHYLHTRDDRVLVALDIATTMHEQNEATLRFLRRFAA